MCNTGPKYAETNNYTETVITKKLQSAETIIMHKNIKKFAATNNYAKINTKQRYIRHADHC